MRDSIWRRLSWRKQLAFQAARLCPARWRFSFFGLPAATQTTPKSVGTANCDDLFELAPGTACQQGAHLDAVQMIVPSLSPGANGPMEERFILRQRFFPKVKKMSGTVASLALDGDVNYFHWLVETLPRWRFLQEQEAGLSGIYVCQKHPFHREALRRLGLNPQLILDSAKIPYLRADHLLVPRYIKRQEPWILPWLREQFLSQPSGPALRPKSSRIYISRRAATSRGVANEVDLLSTLDEFGFVSVILEELPWLEQIALFQNAEVVVGAHGAGLTNLVFCKSSTSVLELIPEDLQGPFYEEIGSALKLDYHTLRCPSSGPGDLHSQPITVETGKVRDLLKSRFA